MHVAPHEHQDEDVFVQMGGTTQPAADGADPLDDVFGSDTESPTGFARHEGSTDHRESHPSDARRLQAEHTTQGYREGITAAKAESIQAGFDEGFSLGATIGQKAGQLLGLLEGITSALLMSTDQGSESCSRAQKLLEDARRELSVESIYDQEYWAPDGTWKFAVGHDQGEDENDTIVFEDVADWHPLLRRWSKIVHEETQKWKINREVLDLPNETTARDSGLEKKEVKLDQAKREVLDW